MSLRIGITGGEKQPSDVTRPGKIRPYHRFCSRPTIVRATTGGREDSLHLLCLQLPDLSLDSTPFSPQFNKGPLCLKNHNSNPCLASFNTNVNLNTHFVERTRPTAQIRAPPWNWPLSSLPVNLLLGLLGKVDRGGSILMDIQTT